MEKDNSREEVWTVLNELSPRCVKSNSRPVAHIQRSGSIPVAHRDSQVPGAIAIEKWPSVLLSIREKAPALIHACPRCEKSDDCMLCGEEFGNHRERNAGNQIAKVIDMQNMGLYAAAEASRTDAGQRNERGRLKSRSQLRKNLASIPGQVCAGGGEDIASVKGGADLRQAIRGIGKFDRAMHRLLVENVAEQAVIGSYKEPIPRVERYRAATAANAGIDHTDKNRPGGKIAIGAGKNPGC